MKRKHVVPANVLSRLQTEANCWRRFPRLLQVIHLHTLDSDDFATRSPFKSLLTGQINNLKFTVYPLELDMACHLS